MFFYTFNEAASNPFSLTGPANCSIFGLHIHTHSYARLHTLTHSLEVGARSDRAISSAAADIVRAEGRRFHRQCARTHGEPRASLPVIPYSKSVHLIYQHKTVFWICLRSWKNGWELKDAGGTECDVYLKCLVNIYCDNCTNYYVNLSAVDRASSSRCAVCHLD